MPMLVFVSNNILETSGIIIEKSSSIQVLAVLWENLLFLYELHFTVVWNYRPITRPLLLSICNAYNYLILFLLFPGFLGILVLINLALTFWLVTILR